MKPQKRDTHLDETLTPLLECPVCGTLVDAANSSEECPACGDSAGVRREFPPQRQRRLDQRIRRYYADGDYEVVVILAATFLETLLEDALAQIMEAQGAHVRLRAAVLDAQRSVGLRLGKLFPTLTGRQFEDVAAQLGLPDFPHRWRALRTERNAFIHDSAFEGPKEELNQSTAQEAMVLLGQAYKLFSGIHNRFAVNKDRMRKGRA